MKKLYFSLIILTFIFGVFLAIGGAQENPYKINVLWYQRGYEMKYPSHEAPYLLYCEYYYPNGEYHKNIFVVVCPDIASLGWLLLRVEQQIEDEIKEAKNPKIEFK